MRCASACSRSPARCVGLSFADISTEHQQPLLQLPGGAYHSLQKIIVDILPAGRRSTRARDGVQRRWHTRPSRQQEGLPTGNSELPGNQSVGRGPDISVPSGASRWGPGFWLLQGSAHPTDSRQAPGRGPMGRDRRERVQHALAGAALLAVALLLSLLSQRSEHHSAGEWDVARARNVLGWIHRVVHAVQGPCTTVAASSA
jgi:hypothetical protein